jgi:hypothetical protein
VKQLTEAIAQAGRIYMLDTSPMFIRRLSADSSGDPFRQGQIRVIARYGVLYKKPTYEKLNQANMDGATAEPAEPIQVMTYESTVQVEDDTINQEEVYPEAGTINTSDDTFM